MALRESWDTLSPLQTMLQIHLRLLLCLGLREPLSQLLLLYDVVLLLLLVCLHCCVALRKLHLACDIAQTRADDVAIPNDCCAAVDCDVQVQTALFPPLRATRV